MMKQAGRGFTLVEVIIVIVVIAVLAAITTLGLTQVQQQARDATRDTDAISLAEALEKYYDENGEYPSCAMMTASAGSVSSLLSVDVSILQAPLSDDENSYICEALASGGGEDEFAYVGDGSTSCETGSSCLEWEIQYRTEGGEIKTINSRRTASLVTSGAPGVSLTVVSNTQINIAWTAVSNAVSYRVERSTNASMSGAVSQSVSGTSMAATGLNAGERYYVRVTPQLATQAGQASDITNAVTTISAPSGTLAVAASLQTSNTQAQGVASGASCSNGTTIRYALGSQGRNTNSSVSISYGSWSTNNTRTVSASQGYNYTFQAKARCQGSDATSSETTSTTASVTRPIDKPAMPNYTGDTSFRAGYRYNMTYNSYCPSGTWVDGYIYIYNYGMSGSAYYPGSSTGGAVNTPWGRFYTAPLIEWWYLGFAAGQVWEDVDYYAFYSCKTDFTGSSHSDHRHTYVTVECESARRNYSANPRCDYYGQSGSSLPWGP
ncbi:TPA: hypothetical protein DD425_02265 [Candidatus Saccharibacteria bacterium]|nr:hypothetical protein [Candidatus Saccharibacteria bacterium]|tara:strand:+ start:3337 stop:4815 length:1479 start_codon:yes stop_codon:yes gene_type:complete